ncbi:FtsB family cell division protein [Aquibacillus rhizosphaerae]|uniref:Septum formation initiator family protein n=1 Tax=Aquibacillus rhizosphaerae TaxID=3051431 RepID=A0ABT7L515_9BACI|nr:septum formation initiator family protein [Aquibacillus sp. LR5S19]MDL4840484.1 septum formation initiator family protein [Aquibacillus sp. LR5S19]
MTRKQRKIAKIDSTYMKQYDAHVERQKKKKKRLHRRLVLFSIVVMITLGTITTYHLKQRMLHAQKEEQQVQLEEKLASLKKEEKDLSQEVELLNDEEYVLQIAKTNYFFSKEGEVIFKLPEEDLSY